MKGSELKAISLMIGCIIGAGILALPYAISKTGVLIGVGMLAVIGLIVILLSLYMGEVILRTKKLYEISGYAEKYIGNWAKHLMAFSIFVIATGALVAYTIGVGEIFHSLFGLDKFLFGLLFFAIMSVFIFFDLKFIASSERVFVVIMLAVLVSIMGLSLGKFDFGNLMHFDIFKIMIPYGVILFSIANIMVLPEAVGVLKKNKKNLKKIIIIGISIPLIVYILFSLIVIGVNGFNVSEVATIGLGGAIGNHVLYLGNIFAFFSMMTSFLVLGLAMKWVLWRDYKWDKHIAWFAALSLPLIVFLLSITSFVKAILITGAISGGIEGIIVIWMFNNAKKKGERKPEYVIKHHIAFDLLIALMFFVGISYTIWSLF